jgi:hypothetical protein
LNTGRNSSNTPTHDPGKIIKGTYGNHSPEDPTDTPPTASRLLRQAIMQDVPDAPSPQIRSAVAARISAHVKQGWPHLGEPVLTYRGQFCYVAARLPGQPQPQPILRLRYQGSADRWAIGVYLASDQRYTEAELPTSFGHRTGTPEQGIDHTFILYAGPSRQP